MGRRFEGSAERKNLADVKLKEIMSVSVINVNADPGIDQAAQLMPENGTWRVLVTRGEKVIGVITSKTLMSALKAYVDTISMKIAGMQDTWG